MFNYGLIDSPRAIDAQKYTHVRMIYLFPLELTHAARKEGGCVFTVMYRRVIIIGRIVVV
jgi:hypothetical protein